MLSPLCFVAREKVYNQNEKNVNEIWEKLPEKSL
jgi:hypothetical protein